MDSITWMPVEADEPPSRPVPEQYYHENVPAWLPGSMAMSSSGFPPA